MVAKKKQVTHDRPAGSPFTVSQSTIKAWRRCRQLYDYRYVQLVERRKPVLQLIRGTMTGKCLDLMAERRIKPKGPKWQTALAPYRVQYDKLFADEREYYGDPIGEVERIVTRYEQIYANDGLTYLAGKDGKPYEIEVEVELVPGIAFTGHIDKMPQDKQGRVWDMDHKTHKVIPGPDDRFADLQQVFYQWAMPLSGYPRPAGVIWDYLRTKPPAIPETLKAGGLTQRKNIDTDHDTYMAEVTRLKLNPKDYPILKELKLRGTMDFYQRVSLPSPNKGLIQTIVSDATETAVEMKKLGGVSKTRSMTRECTRCEYHALCEAEMRGLDADYIRKTEYQVNKEPRHIHVVEFDN